MKTVFTFNSFGSDKSGIITVCVYSSTSSRVLPEAISHVVIQEFLPIRFEFVNSGLTPARFKYFVSSLVNLSGESMLKRATGSLPFESEDDDLFNFMFD